MQNDRFSARAGWIWKLAHPCCNPVGCLSVRYPAKIVEVDDRDMTVLIHFDGWNQRYDEWVKMTSDELKPLAENDRVKKEIPHVKSVSAGL